MPPRRFAIIVDPIGAMPIRRVQISTPKQHVRPVRGIHLLAVYAKQTITIAIVAASPAATAVNCNREAPVRRRAVLPAHIRAPRLSEVRALTGLLITPVRALERPSIL